MSKCFIKKIDIPIYFGYLVIIVAEDYKDVPKKYSIEFKDGYSAYCLFKSINSIAHNVIILNKISNSIIAHEASHIASGILMHACVNADFDNDEPYDYMIG